MESKPALSALTNVTRALLLFAKADQTDCAFVSQVGLESDGAFHLAEVVSRQSLLVVRHGLLLPPVLAQHFAGLHVRGVLRRGRRRAGRGRGGCGSAARSGRDSRRRGG